MIAALRDASTAYLHIYAPIDFSGERLHQEHQEILTACTTNDPPRAAQAVQHHLDQSASFVSAELRRDELAARHAGGMR